jgi:hypothetical protein
MIILQPLLISVWHILNLKQYTLKNYLEIILNQNDYVKIIIYIFNGDIKLLLLKSLYLYLFK